MITYRIPKRFYEDHIERCGDDPDPDDPNWEGGYPGAGVIVKTTVSHYTVELNDAQHAELLSDARHYADPYMAAELGPDYFGLVSSARSTVKALEAVR
jgi:hypothetical protein